MPENEKPPPDPPFPKLKLDTSWITEPWEFRREIKVEASAIPNAEPDSRYAVGCAISNDTEMSLLAEPRPVEKPLVRTLPTAEIRSGKISERWAARPMPRVKPSNVDSDSMTSSKKSKPEAETRVAGSRAKIPEATSTNLVWWVASRALALFAISNVKADIQRWL
jgi:hypothetical protein